MATKKSKPKPKPKSKTEKVMHEFGARTLHSGRNGPIVESRKQAIAIALSEEEQAKKKAKRGRK